MQRLMLALRVFFAIAFGRIELGDAQRLLEGGGDSSGEAAVSRPPAVAATPSPERARPKPAPRSEALTLLAALQREARFVDIVNEPLGDYSDEQIGAAARDVLRDCRTVLQRMFDLQPLVAEAEGEQVDVPAGYDPAAYRLTGSVQGDGPYRGQLVHRGWRAERCEVPAWTGNERSGHVVAAAEVEIS